MTTSSRGSRADARSPATAVPCTARATAGVLRPPELKPVGGRRVDELRSERSRLLRGVLPRRLAQGKTRPARGPSGNSRSVSMGWRRPTLPDRGSDEDVIQLLHPLLSATSPAA